MPDPLELLILGVCLALAGAFVLAPLLRPGHEPADGDADPGELESARIRHRISLEALRDVEADRRAGSLDDVTYAAELAEAEERAARTRVALAQRAAGAEEVTPVRGPSRVGLAVAGIIGLAVVVGAAVPGTGIANETVVDERLAAAESAEADRQERIAELRAALAVDPSDAETLSALADAHLAGSTSDDLVRAAVALRLLIDLEPERADAYERIIAAYLRAGDYANARAAQRSYAAIPTADPVEVAFFDGLIALRGEGDPEAATAAFDRFLELAPEDPRVEMIRTLRAEAAASD